MTTSCWLLLDHPSCIMFPDARRTFDNKRFSHVC